MPNSSTQKMRLLYLLRIFLKQTSEKGGLSTNQILDELERLGAGAERKALYRDFKAMRSVGINIEQNGKREWYLVNRPFSTVELQLLADAVQSASFLTDDLTESLIDKLRVFAPVDEEKSIGGYIELSARVKMMNEGVFTNMSIIQDATRQRRKLEFKYFDFDASREPVLRKDGAIYRVDPLLLAYADDRYYLLTYNEKHGRMTPFRVDRMVDVRLANDSITKKREVATWRLEDDVVLSFGIFGASVKPVTLAIEESRINTLVDKFGPNVPMFPFSQGWMKAHVKAPLSPQFFGWLLQLGTHIKILGPKKVIGEYKEYLANVMEIYE